MSEREKLAKWAEETARVIGSEHHVGVRMARIAALLREPAVQPDVAAFAPAHLPADAKSWEGFAHPAWRDFPVDLLPAILPKPSEEFTVNVVPVTVIILPRTVTP